MLIFLIYLLGVVLNFRQMWNNWIDDFGEVDLTHAFVMIGMSILGSRVYYILFYIENNRSRIVFKKKM